MSKGWDHGVVMGGRTMSRGQRQRFALARTLAAPVRFVLLDEPTSAQDHTNAVAIFDNLRAMADSDSPAVTGQDRKQVACAVMAYIVMAYIVMAYTVMAKFENR